MNEATAAKVLGRPLWVRITGWSVLAVFLFLVILGIYWSRTPKVFWVNEYVENGTHVVGYSTTDTLIRVAETMLDKPGGYLSNDIMPPGVWLDNIPNWEFGVLTQVRDLARVMRNDYSRSQSQSAEDPDLAEAEPNFFFDNNSWWLPPSEGRYREAIEGFVSYRDRLTGSGGRPDAQF